MSCVVKEEMIEWWGPIILEYYGATEGHGLTACDTAEWLTHRGTVGRVVAGELHVLDEAMQPVATGTPGTLWFKTASEFEYFKDPERTAAHDRLETQPGAGSIRFEAHRGEEGEDGARSAPAGSLAARSRGSETESTDCRRAHHSRPKAAQTSNCLIRTPFLRHLSRRVVRVKIGQKPGVVRGTGSSNPSPSSRESRANQTFIDHGCADACSPLTRSHLAIDATDRIIDNRGGRHPCSANSAAIRTRRPQKAKRSRRSGRLWAKATPAEIATTPPTASGIPKRQSTCPAPA